jgi:hypothetical protein
MPMRRPCSPASISASSSPAGVVGPNEAPVLLATLVVIAATLAQVVVLLAMRGKKVDMMLWISLVLVVVLGGATVWFHNETFIKWKPSGLYWAMALTLVDQQALLRQEPDPGHDGQAELRAARGGLEPPQLAPGSRSSPSWAWLNLYVAYTSHLGLGQLQGLRRHRPDGAVHGGARPLPERRT